MKKTFLRLLCVLVFAGLITIPVIGQDASVNDVQNAPEVDVSVVDTDAAAVVDPVVDPVADPVEDPIAAVDAIDDGAQAATLENEDQENDADAGLEASKDAEENKNIAKIKEMRAAIKKLIAEKLFDKAGNKIADLKKYIDSQDFSKERKTNLQASVLRRETVAFQSAQGHYQVAADAMRRAIELNAVKTDTGRLVKLQTMVTKRDKWLKDRIEHNQKMKQLLEKKQSLLEEKAKIIKKMDNSKKGSDEQFKALKAELKAVNLKLSPLNEKIVAEVKQMTDENKKMREQGLILSEEKRQKLLPSMMKKMAARFGCYSLRKQIYKHLTNLAENNEIKWKGMEPVFFRGIEELQDEIVALKKELSVFAGKAPLSAADLKIAEKLKRQIDRKMATIERRIETIEDGFVSDEAFGKLTGKEKAEFTRVYKLARARDKDIAKLEKEIENLYEKIFTTPTAIDPESADAPQAPDDTLTRDDNLATPTAVIEEKIDNEDKPANLMNAF